MHSTILNIGKKTNETYLFERMVVEWPGIDYVGRNDQSTLGSILEKFQSAGVPIKDGCLLVTKELRDKLNSERQKKIKEFADEIYGQTRELAEYDLQNVLEDYPYEVYVVVDRQVITLSHFLRIWEPGEYVITETFDYHY